MAPISIDVATRQALVAQQQAAHEECEQLYRLVTNSQSSLGSVWKGTASNAYGNSLQEWLNGFLRVREGIKDLGDAMVSFGATSDQGEDTNTGNANWAR